MNVREGFARIAKVCAVAYWCIALIAFVATFRSEMQVYTSTGPYSGDMVWEWSRFGEASTETLTVAFWTGMAYLVLVAIFRGLRWIAAGFMHKPA